MSLKITKSRLQSYLSWAILYIAYWYKFEWCLWVRLLLTANRYQFPPWCHKGDKLYDDAVKWKHSSAPLTICEGNQPVPGGFPSQRPMTRSFAIFLWCAPEQTAEQTMRMPWFNMPWRSLWRCLNKWWLNSLTHACAIRRPQKYGTV